MQVDEDTIRAAAWEKQVKKIEEEMSNATEAEKT